MNIENGQYIAGEFLGTKMVPKSNTDGSKQWQEHYIGVSIPVTSGYNGQAATIDVRLSKEAVEKGLQNSMEQYVGKFVLVPINPMARAYKDKAYVTNYFDTRRQIIVPNEMAKLAKVS